MNLGGVLAPAVLLGLLLGCASSPDAPAPAASAPGASATTSGPTIGFRDGELDFDGHRVEYPTTAERLATVLGPYVRGSDFYGSTCRWDALGLEAHEEEPAGRIRRMTLRCCGDSAAAADGAPASCFRGRVVLPTGSLDGASRPAELEALGLVSPTVDFGGGLDYGGRLGRSLIRVGRSRGVTTIGLSWNEARVHPARGASGEPPLFTIRAREHGCDFDENLVELNREGNVSIVRFDIYGKPSQGSVGRSFFAMGAYAALAIDRGYRYWVKLDSPERQADAPAGGGSHWEAIGFTNDNTPDVAREFPGRTGRGGNYEALSCDWALFILGDFPELASAPASR